VGVCVFPYTYTEFTSGYVCISVYSHRVHVCVYMFTYIRTGFPCVFVCIHVYIRGVYTLVIHFKLFLLLETLV